MTARASSSGLARAYGTTILLQHNSLPRTPFYAQRYFKGLYESMGVPRAISGKLANVRCHYSKKLQSALEGSAAYPTLQQSHSQFGAELSKKLSEVLPEFGPFNTHVSYLYDEPYIADEIKNIVERGADRLLVLSLYPFEYPHLVDPLKRATSSALKRLLKEVQTTESGKSMHVAENRPVTFELERFDSIGTHPSLWEYWAERILNNIGNADALIFAVPMPSILNRYKFFETVHESAYRIMVQIFAKFNRSVSYRVAFYPSWDHSLPSYPMSRAVDKQITMLACFERHDPLIIPFGSLFKDFDTEYVLPTSYQGVRVLSPDENDKNLVHSCVELLKTKILTEKCESDKEPSKPLF